MRALVVSVALVAMAGGAMAESDAECLARWKAADLNANGTFEVATDSADYAAALSSEDGDTDRNRFLTLCKQGQFASIAKPDNPAAGRDMGKGDLTGGPPLSKAAALKKLEALGYRDVKDLALDAEGIWRGSVNVHGKMLSVAIDPQGDVVSR
jgi:hypothetical protein